MDHKLEFNETIKSNDKLGPSPVSPISFDKKEYEVVAEGGMFKHGRQYNKGDKILLVEKTAANFLAAGDIKNIS